ncbi:MAG TPA: hypothetical protein VF062_18500 [Candidatus Limnocylindrales bacterium]
MTTVPTPLVPWETVVRLADPLHEPTRQRLRTLKASRTASDGIRVVMRSRGRVRGSATYYSSVTALGAALKQSGESATSRRLAAAGERIEKRFSEFVRAYLQEHPIGDLDQAPFYPRLLDETQKALDFVLTKDDGTLLLGEVKRTWNDLSEVNTDYQGQHTVVALPTALLRQIDAAPGDHVLIIRRLEGAAAMLTVLPAVHPSRVDIHRPDDRHVEAALDEERLGEKYMTTGPGAPMSEAEASFLASMPDGELPEAKVLRLAG